jgi:hypothetical protein
VSKKVGKVYEAAKEKYPETHLPRVKEKDKLPSDQPKVTVNPKLLDHSTPGGKVRKE